MFAISVLFIFICTMKFPENYSVRENESILTSYSRMAPVSSEVLLKCNTAGRNLLGFLIERVYADVNNHIIINQFDVMQWYTYVLKPGYATSYNVSRGIKELERLNVINKVESSNSTYILNTKLLDLNKRLPL